MPTLGRFETVRELHRSGRVAVYSARPAGDESAPELSIKTLDPSSEVDRVERAKTVELFLEQATFQERLGNLDGSCWAPIHNLTTATGGLFYSVSDLYLRSAQALIDSRASLLPRQLHNVASAVIKGLVQIKQRAGRPHGNLKPTNVLIAGDDVGQCKIVLSDPLPTKKLGTEHSESADLRALGELIYRLVAHRAPSGEASKSGALSAEWARLGKTGVKWHALCRRLLSAGESGQSITIEETAAAISKLAPGSKRGWWLAAGAAGAVGAIVLASFIWPGLFQPQPEYTPLPDPDWSRLCAEHRAWFDSFHAAAEPKSRERWARLQDDAYLRETIVRLMDDEAARKKLSPWDLVPFRRINFAQLTSLKVEPDSIDSARQALQSIDGVRAKLREWPVLQSLVTQRKEFQERGWGGPAEVLDRLILEVTLPLEEEIALSVQDNKVASIASKDIAGAVEEILKRSQTLDRIEAIWHDTESQLAVVEAANDPLLAAMRAMITHHAKAVESMEKLREVMEEHSKLATSVAEAVKKSWLPATFDLAYFRKECRAYSQLEVRLDAQQPADAEMFRPWLDDQMPNSDEDPRTEFNVKDVVQRLLKDIKDVRAVKPEIARAEGLDAASPEDELKEILLDPEKVLWNRGNKSKIETAVNESRERTTLLGRRVSRAKGCDDADTNAFITRISRAPLDAVSHSVAIHDKWVALREEFVNQKDKVKFEDLCPQWVTIGEWITELDKDVHDAIPGEFGALPDLEAAVKAKRESVLSDALAPLVWSEVKKPEQWIIKAAKHNEWLAAVREIGKTFVAIQDRLNEAYGLVDAYAGPDREGQTTIQQLHDREIKKPQFENEVVIALSAITKRVEKLQTIAGATDHAELVREATKSEHFEASLAAWRRLGALSSWPASVEDFRAEMDIRREVDATLRTIKMPRQDRLTEVRKQVEIELVDQGLLRCNRFFASSIIWSRPNIEYELGAAVELMDLAKIETERLDAAAQWKLLAGRVLTLPVSLDTKVTEKLKPVDVMGLELESRRLEFEMIAKKEPAPSNVSKLLEDLRDIFKELKAKPPVEFKTEGPGAVGWSFAKTDDDKAVTYNTTIASQTHSLTFRNVKPPAGGGDDVRAAYVCTTEMSLGLFGDCLTESKSNARTELLAMINGAMQNTKDGPRGWSMAANGSIGRKEYWVINDAEVKMLKERSMYRDDWHAPLKGQSNDFLLGLSGNSPPGRNPEDVHPIQHIPPDAAILAARILNCRLPTPAEWQWALEADRASQNVQGGMEYIKASRANVRDATWGLQHAYIKKQFPFLSWVWPDRDVFFPSGKGSTAREADAKLPGDSYDDRTLWFAGVSEGGGKLFNHLIGNVAEFVWEDDTTFQNLAPNTKAIRDAIVANRDKLRVMGGSALSDSTLVENDKPHAFLPGGPIDAVRGIQSNSDVGFRLAFSVSGGVGQQTIIDKIRKKIDEFKNAPD